MTADGNVKQAVPFFGVKDMESSLRYYIDGLGFEMTLKWTPDGKIRWCWLKKDQAAIMLQEYHPDFLPKEKLGEGVTICFICEDTIALYREFKTRGIEATVPEVGNGMWSTPLRDPDGYRINFESETDVPEDTILPDP